MNIRLGLAITCAAWTFGVSVTAETLRTGCYHRDYTAAHLKKHPEQIVDWITMTVERDTDGYLFARMMVATANQGHAKRSGMGDRIFNQWLGCFDDGGRTICAVDCDGGNFMLTRRTSDSLTIQTKYLMVGETGECGGAIDLAEKPMTSVKYRLDVVPDGTCDGL